MAEISSAGRVGLDLGRSAGRAYNTLPERSSSVDSLVAEINSLDQKANEAGRRRWVLRGRFSSEVAQNILEGELIKSSVSIPLSILGMGDDRVLMFEHNQHSSDVPEWSSVYEYWQTQKQYDKPVAEIEKISQDFHLTNQLTHNDTENLFRIWKPFGWTKNGVENFIETYHDNPNIWFSGVRKHDGQLASACMGEGLNFSGIYMVEATEFGTEKEYRGHNLCTSAVIGLISQVVDTALYRHGVTPMIIAELNMSSRSDKVARKAGMTIPEVAGVAGLTKPHQVLRKNVAVLDDQPPNDLFFASMSPEEKIKYRDAYRDRYRFWRNFIVGVLDKSTMEQLYSTSQVEQIMSHFRY